MFSASKSSYDRFPDAASRMMLRIGVVFASRFCFTGSDSTLNRRSSAESFFVADLDAIVIEQESGIQALQEPATCDVFGQFLDRNVRSDGQILD